MLSKSELCVCVCVCEATSSGFHCFIIIARFPGPFATTDRRIVVERVKLKEKKKKQLSKSRNKTRNTVSKF